MEEMELSRPGGEGLAADMMGGSWFDPDSNVVGIEAASADDAVSARVRFLGFAGLGERDRRANCEMGEWLGALMRSGSNSLGGGGWCGRETVAEPKPVKSTGGGAKPNCLGACGEIRSPGICL